MSSLLVASRRLIVVVGPSGAGKDSVISAWLQRQTEAARPHRARRTITRPADVHEAHESITAAAFAAVREAGGFAFHWQAHGLDYGVRHGELAALGEGGWVVMNGSREHLAQLRAVAPQARVVEIDAPAALRQRRLHDRSREDADGRAARVVRQAPPAQADLRIVNDGPLDQAVAALEGWWTALAAGDATGDCGISTPGARVIDAET